MKDKKTHSKVNKSVVQKDREIKSEVKPLRYERPSERPKPTPNPPKKDKK